MGSEPSPSPDCISQNAARKIVPAIITSLYKMVSDKSNDDLIRWSKNGDSFFVRQPDRFVQEVLGKWFKHNGYSSFVCQLKNYGFQKVPHFQQGTLRSNGMHGHYHYRHPNFQLNRKDLLGHIQRNSQPIHGHPIRYPSRRRRPASMPNIRSAHDTSLWLRQREPLDVILDGIRKQREETSVLFNKIMELAEEILQLLSHI